MASAETKGAGGASTVAATAGAATAGTGAGAGAHTIVPGGQGRVVDAAAAGRWIIGKTNSVLDFYDLGAQMGEPGQFGRAVRATHRESKAVRACKIINKARFARASPADQKYHYEALRGEIKVMSLIDHPNVIKLNDVFETTDDLYIVMELCGGGELFDRIKAVGSFSEKAASDILRQITTGIRYLHSKGIAHCDLKPDNFLFLNSTETAPLKIIDFGMSKFVKNREYFNTLCGTPYYVAPEVIEGKYSEHCDMWSLGVIMFVMLFGYPPFYADQGKYGERTDSIIFGMIQAGFQPSTKAGYGAHFPEAIRASDSAKELIASLLTLDTAKRLTAAEALAHPWMTGAAASTTPLVDSVLTGLWQFNGANKFKKVVLNLMVDSLASAEIKQLRATFVALDENKDGKISAAELKKALNKPGGSELKGITEAELVRLMSVADVNGDGSLNYEELLMTTVNRKLVAKEERLYQAFLRFDLNGDGRVSAAEIAALLGDARLAEELIREVDVDGDGTVSYDEFLLLWKSKEAAATGATAAAAPTKKAATAAAPAKAAPTAATATTAVRRE